MKRILTRLARLGRALEARRTHPHIKKSLVTNLSEVDATARISRSTINGTVAIGARAVLDVCSIVANEKVTVGARTILTGPIRIVADRNPVFIGKFCSFAPDVVIWESLHDMKRLSTSHIQSEFFGGHWTSDVVSKGPIHVGNDVWIGTRAIVLSGVTVGDGAVIGAGAVVTRDVPPYSVVAGSPASVVKSRFPKPLSDRLLELKWWDWPEEKIKLNRFLFDDELSLEILDQIK